MKVNYSFIKVGEDDYRISSNLKSNGLDMLELISSDVSERTLGDFLQCIDKKERWWSNAAKVEFSGDIATIYPAFLWDEEINPEETKFSINTRELKKILKEWVVFSKKNKL